MATTCREKSSFYALCLLIQKYFCAVYDYVGKADLSKGYWNPKRKLGVSNNIFLKSTKIQSNVWHFSQIEA